MPFLGPLGGESQLTRSRESQHLQHPQPHACESVGIYNNHQNNYIVGTHELMHWWESEKLCENIQIIYFMTCSILDS